jgi:hypothetical protein
MCDRSPANTRQLQVVLKVNWKHITTQGTQAKLWCRNAPGKESSRAASGGEIHTHSYCLSRQAHAGVSNTSCVWILVCAQQRQQHLCRLLALSQLKIHPHPAPTPTPTPRPKNSSPTCASVSSRLVGTTSSGSPPPRPPVAAPSTGPALRSATSSWMGTSAWGVGGRWRGGRVIGEGWPLGFAGASEDVQ